MDTGCKHAHGSGGEHLQLTYLKGIKFVIMLPKRPSSYWGSSSIASENVKEVHIAPKC